MTPIPFGGSFVLEPAYWSAEGQYHHHPSVEQVAIDISALPDGPLRISASGTEPGFPMKNRFLVSC